MREEGKVVTGMRVLMGSGGLVELSHKRGKGPLVIEPMGQEMHADKRQTGRNLDKMTLRFSFFFERSLDAVALCLD